MKTKKNNIDIILKFLKEIENLNYEAYLIGGAPRDYVLNLNINDYDVTTNIEKTILENNFNIIKKNKDFFNYIINYENVIIQLTLFREDFYKDKSRFPKVISTNDFNKDLNRRDFTINTIYMNYEKKLFFPNLSKFDLEHELIRCVIDPNVSFTQDPLRILRAIKYALKLNFEIEKKTFIAMQNNKDKLNNISIKRCLVEYQKIQKYKNYQKYSEFYFFLIK